MKSRNFVRAIAGVLLCAAGLWLALPTPYRERTFLIDAGGCRLETTIVEKREGGSQGSVLLFHGIGEDDAAAVAFPAAKPQNRFLECQDCRIQRVSMRDGQNKVMSVVAQALFPVLFRAFN
jgi:hypothetical protein